MIYFVMEAITQGCCDEWLSSVAYSSERKRLPDAVSRDKVTASWSWRGQPKDDMQGGVGGISMGVLEDWLI